MNPTLLTFEPTLCYIASINNHQETRNKKNLHLGSEKDRSSDWCDGRQSSLIPRWRRCRWGFVVAQRRRPWFLEWWCQTRASLPRGPTDEMWTQKMVFVTPSLPSPNTRPPASSTLELTVYTGSSIKMYPLVILLITLIALIRGVLSHHHWKGNETNILYVKIKPINVILTKLCCSEIQRRFSHVGKVGNSCVVC